MAKWEKTLARMLNDPNPVGYEYDEAAVILRNLGFELPKRKPKGSHRMWGKRINETQMVMIGLVDYGSGPLKGYLIRDMVRTLRAHGLIPASME